VSSDLLIAAAVILYGVVACSILANGIEQANGIEDAKEDRSVFLVMTFWIALALLWPIAFAVLFLVAVLN